MPPTLWVGGKTRRAQSAGFVKSLLRGEVGGFALGDCCLTALRVESALVREQSRVVGVLHRVTFWPFSTFAAA